MPKQLVNLSVSSPGFYGLNKQQQDAILPPGWASEATNLIFDDAGQLSSRQGYRHALTSALSSAVGTIHEYIDGVGNRVVIFAAGNVIYRYESTGVPTDISGTITTPTGDAWQFVNFNSKCIGFQAGHTPIVLSATDGTFSDISYTTATYPSTGSSAALSAFGRVWVLDGTNLRFSDLLIETAWDDGGGTPLPNVFDLSSYWKGGMDEGVAIAEYNGYLVVFGRDNIIVYSDPDDPLGNMAIVESIGGIGCIARDSVQDVGTDLLFLSRTGVRSLGRTIQEKSMPVRDVSKNIKDHLILYVGRENNEIKSVYSPEDGFYLLSLSEEGKTFAFDLKFPLQDGSLRVTEWDLAPTNMLYTKDNILYMAVGTQLAYYTGYLDAVERDGTGGSSYPMNWIGGWNDFGDQVKNLIKIPKKMSLLMSGIADITVTAKWYFDYSDTVNSSEITFEAPSALSRYGSAKYNVDVYGGALAFSSVKTSMAKTGQVMKFGIGADVSNEKITVRRIDLVAKVGRYAL